MGKVENPPNSVSEAIPSNGNHEFGAGKTPGDESNRLQWHSMPVEKALSILDATDSGLSDDEVHRRLSKYGRNELTPPKKMSFWMKLFLQIHNILIYILLAAAIVSGALQEWAEVGLILGVIILNVAIGLIQEGKAEKATEAIKNMLSPKAIVLRNGHQQEIEGVSSRHAVCIAQRYEPTFCCAG